MTWVTSCPSSRSCGSYRRKHEKTSEKNRGRGRAKLAKDPEYYRRRYAANEEKRRDASRRYRERQKQKKQAALQPASDVRSAVVLTVSTIAGAMPPIRFRIPAGVMPALGQV